MSDILYTGAPSDEGISLRVQYAKDRVIEMSDAQEILLVAPTEEQDLVLTQANGFGMARMVLAVFRSILHQHGEEMTAAVMDYVVAGLYAELADLSSDNDEWDA